MRSLSPVSRNDLIRDLRHFGFTGPFSGGKHQFMVRGAVRVRLPGPHGSDISADLLTRILAQAGIPRDEWLGR